MHDTTPRQLQKPKADGNRGLLRRLRYSESGNVIAITAAALVPLIALVGGGVDLSRIYLTKTRLQQACDAGALAARKSMNGVTWTKDSEAIANQFFKANFPEGRYGTGTIEFNFGKAKESKDSGAVKGTASVPVPMTLMAMFDVKESDVAVTCTADLHLPNTDVMFVLDTTLSMTQTDPGESTSRERAMKEAVKSFIDTLEDVKPDGSTIRYGFVPYSSTVNVGRLLKPEWIQDKPEYNSRMTYEATKQKVKSGGGSYTYPEALTVQNLLGQTSTGEALNPVIVGYGNPEDCTVPSGYKNTDVTTDKSTDPVPAAPALPRRFQRVITRDGYYYGSRMVNGKCEILKTEFKNLVVTYFYEISRHPKAGQTEFYPETEVDVYSYFYNYGKIPFSIDGLKKPDGRGGTAGGKIDINTLSYAKFRDTPTTSRNDTVAESFWWIQKPGARAGDQPVDDPTSGCIEERATLRPGESGIRYDMDVNLIPTSDPKTQWKPYLPRLVFARFASPAQSNPSSWNYTDDPNDPRNRTTNDAFRYAPDALYVSCPSPARKFTSGEEDVAAVKAYVDALRMEGYTYHDIGFMWGLRLMSPIGLFKTEHELAEANGRVNRHLIFMTDGEIQTKFGAYTAWGVSAMDRLRIKKDSAFTNNALDNEVTEARLGELCAQAKGGMNITVWTIAFGDEVLKNNATLKMLGDCASTGRYYPAKNAAALNKTFADIASQIAALRITG
ncbi:TadE/TadG family type IV pilus assembly protein [Altererythrobacter sp. Root672]|uniref:TadE/TadG family type IV pilus assembly protein n=1 Tax=Altererythrobacter sp. Root672 TaxID=1736584 RepID=UPI0006FD2333|nr:TadE/TadG family type IV pilus assembly protein [Altererythrobacter sp. Root672]KRA83271.1 hypothetical protein ASD76_04210 [Altererythrobacter sp. Root672]